MSHTRKLLIASLLANPTDLLGRLALADAVEEEGDPDRAALLRVVADLAAIGHPEEPDPALSVYLSSKRAKFTTTCVPDIRLPRLSGCGDTWRGIAGVGRLIGIAAVHWLLQELNPADEGFPILHRHLLRCELYACRMISVKERDDEWKTFDAFCKMQRSHNGVNRSHIHANLWHLRSKGAGRGVNFLQVAESLLFFHRQGGFCSDNDRRRHRALARTRSLHLMQRFTELKPWEAGKRIYEYDKAHPPPLPESLGLTLPPSGPFFPGRAELDLLRALQMKPHGTPTREIVDGMPLPNKQCWYYLDKWYGRGWYDYGVSLDLGWLTDAGKQAFRV